MAQLRGLPAELLYLIHLESASATLPLVSKSFHCLFAESSTRHKAQYILSRHSRKRTLTKAVRYPICTLAVLHSIEQSLLRGDPNQPLPRIDELPRRLVKGLTNSQSAVDIDLVRHLLEKHRVSPDSSNGYFLARAVFANHTALVNLLLSFGASPAMNDGWAVRNAISNGNLGMVKRLLEFLPPDNDNEATVLEGTVELCGKERRKRRKSDEGIIARKRRKVAELRCAPTTKMLEAAVEAKQWNIVDYLTSKGATPSLAVLSMFK